MAQVQGIPYRRHGPSAALREFLDPLDPGGYFDCGRARLHGLDDALLEEARSRGREVGDDAFLLVATDMGLIFCRPSISFAIAARWEDISLIRPRGDDPVVLPVTWPRHGELKFTISKRLAGNIFRRWLQLRMHVARQARQVDRHPRPLPVGTGMGSSTPVGVDARTDDADRDEDVDDPVDGAADGGDPMVDGDGRPGIVVLHEVDEIDEVDTGAGGGEDDEPAAGGESPAPVPAKTSDILPLFDSVVARPADATLDDDDLQRVTVPRTSNPPPSWVGSAVSLAASLVVISTVVLIATVSVSVWRGTSDPSTVATSGQAAGSPPTTIDHERFRTSSDPVGELAPSSAGGASQSIPSSSQQLLAVPADDDQVISAADPNGALRCNSNYSGCVPDVDGTAGADVDCVGQGDGPFFAESEIMVLGDDVYGLDSDGDRLACEADQLGSGG